MPTVEYRDIPKFPGYRAGNDGTVWSCRRRGGGRGKGNGSGGCWIFGDEWKQMKTRKDKSGRPQLALFDEHGKEKVLRVCRLVLLAFVGPCPEGMECCHKDGNPDNNFITNLRWGTRKSNSADTIRHGKSGRAWRKPAELLLNAHTRLSQIGLGRDWILVDEIYDWLRRHGSVP